MSYLVWHSDTTVFFVFFGRGFVSSYSVAGCNISLCVFVSSWFPGAGLFSCLWVFRSGVWGDTTEGLERHRRVQVSRGVKTEREKNKESEKENVSRK